MGKGEALSKEIDRIADKVRHLRTIWLTMASGIAGLLFALSQKKVKMNLVIEIFLYGGAIGVMVVSFLITYEERRRKELIKELEKI